MKLRKLDVTGEDLNLHLICFRVMNQVSFILVVEKNFPHCLLARVPSYLGQGSTHNPYFSTLNKLYTLCQLVSPLLELLIKTRRAHSKSSWMYLCKEEKNYRIGHVPQRSFPAVGFYGSLWMRNIIVTGTRETCLFFFFNFPALNKLKPTLET